MADTRRNARRMGIGLKRLKGLKHVHVVIKSSTTRMRESVLCGGHTESELLRKAYLITKIRLNIINFNRVCRIVVKLVLRSCTQNGGSHRAAAQKSGRGALKLTVKGPVRESAGSFHVCHHVGLWGRS